MENKGKKKPYRLQCGEG